jgi:hypothetical protein
MLVWFDIDYHGTNTISFINKEGIELFQIGKDKIGSETYDTVYIKDDNSVAVSSGAGDNRCITIIDIEKKEIMSTISNSNRTLPFYHLSVNNTLSPLLPWCLSFVSDSALYCQLA